jgi:crotonobetainyl-CoA:carnitine CoA-transferase CaiB-like acyl-CoA transferase
MSFAIATALLQRVRIGKGQYVETSLLEVAEYLLSSGIIGDGGRSAQPAQEKVLELNDRVVAPRYAA